MHCFTAVTACAVLDVLGPPYSDPDGRHCQYYLDFPFSHFTGTTKSIARFYNLDFIEMNSFVINTNEYFDNVCLCCGNYQLMEYQSLKRRGKVTHGFKRWKNQTTWLSSERRTGALKYRSNDNISPLPIDLHHAVEYTGVHHHHSVSSSYP